MLLQSTHYAKLVSCSFHDNLGTALAVRNTNFTLTEIKFMHNQYACQSFSDICELGCSISYYLQKQPNIYKGQFTITLKQLLIPVFIVLEQSGHQQAQYTSMEQVT